VALAWRWRGGGLVFTLPTVACAGARKGAGWLEFPVILRGRALSSLTGFAVGDRSGSSVDLCGDEGVDLSRRTGRCRTPFVSASWARIAEMEICSHSLSSASWEQDCQPARSKTVSQLGARLLASKRARLSARLAIRLGRKSSSRGGGWR
jgi:hypothetical protein